MSETANISQLANKISDDIFKWLKWARSGPLDVNWKCPLSKHQKETHPSDIVFYYQDPYSNKTIYLNTDLKSYAKGSITSTNIKKWIENSSMAVDCANVSEEWKEHYWLHQHINYQVSGLIFVYNHDNEYITDFEEQLNKVESSSIKLAAQNRIYTLGPERIRTLFNITTDLSRQKGNDLFQTMDDYTFFYPDMILSKVYSSNGWKLPASLELISNGWLVVKYRKNNHEGLLIYYCRKGDTVDEFIYLIDYLSHYQLLFDKSKIDIRCVDSDKMAITMFEKARSHYLSTWGGDDTMKSRLELITASRIDNFAPSYCDQDIGMRDK